MKAMGVVRVMAGVGFLVLMGGVAQVGWTANGCGGQNETFDSYVNGSSLHGLGGWIGWEGNPGATALVSQEQARSLPQSVAIAGATDLVHLFCVSGGVWWYAAWQYIPGDFAAAGAGQFDGSYLVLLNRYPVDADENTDDWSVQMQFDSNDGMLKVYYGNGLNTVDVPYDTDRWVKIEAIIDLEEDWTRIYYDDELVTEYSWTGGVLGNGGGNLDIAAIDLFANNSSSVFYDDLLLEPIGPGEACVGPAAGTLDADLTNDQWVDLLDLNVFASLWLIADACSIADIFPQCGDEVVNLPDFGQFIGEWLACSDAGSGCLAEPLTLFEPPGQASPVMSPCACHQCAKEDRPGDNAYGMHLFSGEFHESAVDLKIRGRGLDFVWARKYRSRTGSNGRLGNGWDYSYNIYVERCGTDLVLHDGDGRRDRYVLQSGGTWEADGFFREFVRQPDGSLRLMFADRGVWSFRALDGGPEAGRISAIADRNGNTLSFEYDGQGRLTIIRDTLDAAGNPRAITIVYNPHGFIDTVTDYAGRTVRYEYYYGVEAGGSFGDLKTVRTPAVVGTSTGNDFPDGKATRYTYSSGFADDCLNHNLLTVADGKGQMYLTNTYAATTNAADLDYDRLVRQVRGNAGDIIDVTYAVLTPGLGNNYAVVKTTVNDRVGNVSEMLYDAANRLVVDRRYTGRATATNPTDFTLNLNPPLNPLRLSDPAVYETRYEYNRDSLLTRVVYPNGNSVENVYESALNPALPKRFHGNLRERRRLPGSLGGDQVDIAELFEYDVSFGSCCGSSFVVRHVDGRGNETLHTYDSRGNRTQTVQRIPSIVTDYEYNAFGQMTKRVLPDNGSSHRREDVFHYYSESDGCMNGYLKAEIADAPGWGLTTTYEYDCLGRMIRRVDARGHDRLYEFNALDQVVREQSRRNNDPCGVRYEKDTYYDRNDNIVRIDIQNIDDNDVLQPNTQFTTIYEYDILNYLVRDCREMGSYTGPIPGPVDEPTCAGLPGGEFIVIEYEYDGNRNQTLVRNGEATNGNQPGNTVRSVYDERDLLFQVVRGEGTAVQSTTQYDYDGNRNRVRGMQGLEANDLAGTPRVFSYAYDGYDRLTELIDPMGNRTGLHYDGNGNRVSRRVEGELVDVAGDASNVLLSETTYEYDPMDRRIRTIEDFFDTETQAPLPGGQQLGEARTDIAYSDNSQVIRITDDNLHVTLYAYDTANRKETVTDAKGNTVTFAYDFNSNVTSRTEHEKSDLGNPDELYVTTYAYDSLDRLIRVTDPVGNITAYAYDSRDNRTVRTDALNHEVRYVYDGINRLVRTVRDMDNDGADNDGSDITTEQAWDGSSRLTVQTDDLGNSTLFQYDELDRLVLKQFADQTVQTHQYDVHDNRVVSVDGNNNRVESLYDLLNRCRSKVILPGANVSSATTFETYQYDGLSRVVATADDDSLVELDHDSRSKVIRETVTIGGSPAQTTSSEYDGVGNQILCVYPGGLPITTSYDELDRKVEIRDHIAAFATYRYVGPRRVEQRDYGNQTRLDLTYDGIVPNPSGDFGVKKIVGTRHSGIFSGMVIDERAYTWDPMFSKAKREDLTPFGPQLTHEYTYDPMYRLQRTVVTDPELVVQRDEQYDLDGAGNRRNVIGGTHPGGYLLDPTLLIPGDEQMNQYTATPFDGRFYDDNGNLIHINDGLPDQRNLAYDYRNQMVEFIDVAGGARHTYSYDPLGRRIAKVVDADGVFGSPTETRFFYNGWQVVEEQSNTGFTEATYVYGNYVDEVLVMQRSGNEFFYHSDDLYSVVAITGPFGNVFERYEYEDYGAPLAPSGIGNPYMFTGRRYDPETGLYYYRSRYYDPIAGRFTTRDALGIWGDEGNVGNGTTYAGNNPATQLDPFGYCTWVGEGVVSEGMLFFVGYYSWTGVLINAATHEVCEVVIRCWKFGGGLGGTIGLELALSINGPCDGSELDDHGSWSAFATGSTPLGGATGTLSTDRGVSGGGALTSPGISLAFAGGAQYCWTEIRDCSGPRRAPSTPSTPPAGTASQPTKPTGRGGTATSGSCVDKCLARSGYKRTNSSPGPQARQLISKCQRECSKSGSVSGPTAPSRGGGGNGCFATGTLVWTEHGPKPIEAIEVGDRVASRDMASGALEYQPVLRTFSVVREGLVKLRLAETEVVCSDNHRFFVNNQWVEASDLQRGNVLYSPSHCARIVCENVLLSGKRRLHNFCVAENHNYFIGKDRVLVHNAKRSPVTLGP